MAAAGGPLDISFTATLGRVRPGDTWTCVQLPGSADTFGTAGRSARATATRWSCT